MQGHEVHAFNFLFIQISLSWLIEEVTISQQPIFFIYKRVTLNFVLFLVYSVLALDAAKSIREKEILCTQHLTNGPFSFIIIIIIICLFIYF